MRVAHLEIWTGIAGDMFVGALLDAGWSEEQFRDGIDKLGLPDLQVDVERRRHGSLTGLGIRVTSKEDHHHRGLSEIEQIVNSADLPQPVRDRSLEVFRAIASAEARVHGIEIDKVHFHEVGAHDSIVDVVASVLGVHELGIEQLTADPIPLNRGTVSMEHGKLPVPAPATSILLEGWPIVPGSGEREYVTPTGAALLQVLAQPTSSIPRMSVEHVGFGAGTRDHPQQPNLLRVWIGDSNPFESGADVPRRRVRSVDVIETQVDDMDPRLLAGLSEDLLSAGAHDVYRVPVVMKKGRLGSLLVVIAPAGEAGRFASSILDSSTSLGVRVRTEQRIEEPREESMVETSLGSVRVKWTPENGIWRAHPEYEELARLARDTGLSAMEVQRRLVSEIEPEVR